MGSLFTPLKYGSKSSEKHYLICYSRYSIKINYSRNYYQHSILSPDVRLKHRVLPYNYLYMYACLCARAAWCREGLNTGRKKLFTARPGPIFRLGAKVLSLVLLQKNQKNKTKKNKKKVLYGRNSYWNGIYRYFSKIFTMRKSYVIF